MFSSGKMNTPLTLTQNATLLARFLSTLVFAFFLAAPRATTAQDLLAEKILRWDFQREQDRNQDSKPDGWRRILDREHPHYVDILIQPRNPEYAKPAKEAQATLAKLHHNWEVGRIDSGYVPETVPADVAKFMDRFILHRCLRAEMDGGAAERISPEFPIDSRFAYSLRGEMSAVDLQGHTARIELHLLDDELNVVEILKTSPVSGTTQWRFYSTEVASLPASELKWGRIHVIVEPIPGKLHFSGAACFDTIEVFRLPRLSLTTQVPQHMAVPGESFDIVCTAMGLRHNNSTVKFTLHDSQGHLLDSASVPLQSLQFASASPVEITGAERYVAKQTKVYDGAAAWQVTLNEPGLYRVRVDLGNQHRDARHREILLAAVEESDNFDAGPFAWSIPEFNTVVQPEDLVGLVSRFGASRIKVPVWVQEDDDSMIARLSRMSDQLQSIGTDIVGKLDVPPNSMADGDPEQLLTLSLLRNRDSWEQLIAPVLTRLGMKINWFQLGTDDDLSLMSHPDVAELMVDVRKRMQTYSPDLNLTLAWTWLTSLPENTSTPWNSVHFRDTPQLSAHELSNYLESETKRAPQWISFAPLPSSRYGLLERVRDLTERAIVIKDKGVDSAFLPNPFDKEQGIFQPDGSVGEMLLPWLTLTKILGDAQYTGSIQMPKGSTNHIFSKGNDGIMFVWNDAHAIEQLYLGDNVTAQDIWGREVPISTASSPSSGGKEHVLQVSPWPLILRGVNINVVRWRQQFEVPVTHLASAVGVNQLIPMLFANPFGQSVAGELSLYSPSLFANSKSRIRFEIASQGKQQRQLSVAVKNDASAGRHPLTFDFDIKADRHYQFSVYRDIKLGLGDVEFVWDAVPIEGGLVELRLELINHTDSEVHFDCKIFPAGQAYDRVQIMNAAPGTTQRQFMVKAPTIENGGIWIRCEQIGTGRILNYRVKP